MRLVTIRVMGICCMVLAIILSLIFWFSTYVFSMTHTYNLKVRTKLQNVNEVIIAYAQKHGGFPSSVGTAPAVIKEAIDLNALSGSGDSSIGIRPGTLSITVTSPDVGYTSTFGEDGGIMMGDHVQRGTKFCVSSSVEVGTYSIRKGGNGTMKITSKELCGVTAPYFRHVGQDPDLFDSYTNEGFGDGTTP